MLGSAPIVSPKPANLPPAAPPATSGTASQGGPSFMQFLNEQPAMAMPPQAGPAPASQGSADDATPSKAAPAPSSAQNAATRRKETAAAPPKAPGASPGASAASTEAAAKNAKDAASTATDDATAASTDADDAADEPARTSSLSEFTQLIGLAVPTPTSASDASLATLRALDADGTAATTDGATAAAAGTRLGAAARTGRGLAGADDTAAGGRPTDLPDEKSATVDRRLTDTAVRGADASRSRAVEAAADKAALIAPRNASGDTATAVTARTPDSGGPRPLGAVDAAAPNFAAVLAQSMPSGISAPDATPAPVSGQVHAAVHSPGFAPELAASVSLLAADGVHQAELQLNPADMGPVAVQIIVDGAQAQVSFHAAQADTRQALEQSLPDLAAALQGQGLTLSGGGVFQQARRDARAGDTEGGSGSDRSSRSGDADGRISGSGGVAAVSVRRTAGLLDTFA